MIILLRGHIRNAFDDNKLYDLLKSLDSISPINLYIHTWSIQQNSLSWRRLANIATVITEERIRAYMRDLAPCIRCIQIDPDGQLPLIGTTEGTLVQGGSMPKRGWKNMWAGMERIMSAIVADHPSGTLRVLNTRFDVCSNSNNFDNNMFMSLYKTALTEHAKSPFLFLRETHFHGCDNFFIATVSAMRHLINDFHTNLDSLLTIYPVCIHHEYYVMLHAATLEKMYTK